MLLCCFNFTPAEAHQLDGKWKAFLADEELTIDMSSKTLSIAENKLKIENITMSAGFHGKEQWTIEGKDLKSGENVTLSLNLFDGVILNIAGSGQCFLKQGFILPDDLPKGGWFDGDHWAEPESFSAFFIDDNLLVGYKRYEAHGPYLEDGTMDLIPLGSKNNAKFFRIKADAEDSCREYSQDCEYFYQAMHKITDKYSIMTFLKPTESGFMPTAEGVGVVSRMDDSMLPPTKKK
ncbi:hypothetical protein [Desulfovibrio litoralis]|uniref:hypothetical protein n=1 Tax=Desulfovibrio litoralis TaxID=466107 RepID=UPI001160D323|nr:hypothetical protein [Desulfovibrio litoralis]